jgi:hypothetical protein
MTTKISVEHTIRVYDDNHGWFISIGPDRDGLGLCRVAYQESEDDSQSMREISMPWEHARAVAMAILKLATEHAKP